MRKKKHQAKVLPTGKKLLQVVTGWKDGMRSLFQVSSLTGSFFPFVFARENTVRLFRFFFLILFSSDYNLLTVPADAEHAQCVPLLIY